MTQEERERLIYNTKTIIRCSLKTGDEPSKKSLEDLFEKAGNRGSAGIGDLLDAIDSMLSEIREEAGSTGYEKLKSLTYSITPNYYYTSGQLTRIKQALA